jgi:hypothetical protein
LPQLPCRHSSREATRPVRLLSDPSLLPLTKLPSVPRNGVRSTLTSVSHSRRSGKLSQRKSRLSKPQVSMLKTYRQRVYLEKDLSELQKRKVEMLADKLLDMNIFELRYFALLTKEKI